MLLLRPGPVRSRSLSALQKDLRFECFTARRLTPEWRAVSDRVAVTIIVAEKDPLGALTYALTAGIAGPIVILIPSRLAHEAPDVVEAGALACITMPLDTTDLDRLAGLLTRRTRPARIDATLRLLLDPIARTVRHGTKAVRLSPREFAVLYCLSANSGRPVPADELLRMAWGQAKVQSRQIVDVYVHQLRKKLAALGLPGSIATVRGYGYVLRPVERVPRRGGRKMPRPRR